MLQTRRWWWQWWTLAWTALIQISTALVARAGWLTAQLTKTPWVTVIFMDM
jgi:hypothetical protein